MKNVPKICVILLVWGTNSLAMQSLRMMWPTIKMHFNRADRVKQLVDGAVDALEASLERDGIRLYEAACNSMVCAPKSGLQAFKPKTSALVAVEPALELPVSALIKRPSYGLQFLPSQLVACESAAKEPAVALIKRPPYGITALELPVKPIAATLQVYNSRLTQLVATAQPQRVKKGFWKSSMPWFLGVGGIGTFFAQPDNIDLSRAALIGARTTGEMVTPEEFSEAMVHSKRDAKIQSSLAWRTTLGAGFMVIALLYWLGVFDEDIFNTLIKEGNAERFVGAHKMETYYE